MFAILNNINYKLTLFYNLHIIVWGKNISLIDISSFFIAVILGELIAYIFIVNNIKCNKKIATIILVIIAISFIIFTFFPPKIGLFKDPLINKVYI